MNGVRTAHPIDLYLLRHLLVLDFCFLKRFLRDPRLDDPQYPPHHDVYHVFSLGFAEKEETAEPVKKKASEWSDEEEEEEDEDETARIDKLRFVSCLQANEELKRLQKEELN